MLIQSFLEGSSLHSCPLAFILFIHLYVCPTDIVNTVENIFCVLQHATHLARTFSKTTLFVLFDISGVVLNFRIMIQYEIRRHKPVEIYFKGCISAVYQSRQGYVQRYILSFCFLIQ